MPARAAVLNLDTSSRSTKEVIGLSNFLFCLLLASAEKPWEFGYEPVRIAESRAGHAGSVELLLPPPGDDAGETKRNEANMLARKIHSVVNAQPLSVDQEQPDHTFVQRQARYGDIAILLEQRTNLSYYLSALGDKGSPSMFMAGPVFTTGRRCTISAISLHSSNTGTTTSALSASSVPALRPQRYRTLLHCAGERENLLGQTRKYAKKKDRFPCPRSARIMAAVCLPIRAARCSAGSWPSPGSIPYTQRCLLGNRFWQISRSWLPSPYPGRGRELFTCRFYRRSPDGDGRRRARGRGAARRPC